MNGFFHNNNLTFENSMAYVKRSAEGPPAAPDSADSAPWNLTLVNRDQLLPDSYEVELVEVPYLFCNAGKLGFAPRIAEDKAVFVAVFLEPEVNIIRGAIDIYRQSQLMLASSIIS